MAGLAGACCLKGTTGCLPGPCTCDTGTDEGGSSSRTDDSRQSETCHTSPSAARAHAAHGKHAHAFLVDSGASHHMVNKEGMLQTMGASRSDTVKLADDTKVRVSGMGVMNLLINGTSVRLHDVLVVPSAAHNLLSVSVLVDSGVQVSFCGNSCILTQHESGAQLASLPRHQRLYNLEAAASTKTVGVAPQVNVTAAQSPAALWHARFTHAGYV
jgi:hypothetical protein